MSVGQGYCPLKPLVARSVKYPTLSYKAFMWHGGIHIRELYCEGGKLIRISSPFRKSALHHSPFYNLSHLSPNGMLWKQKEVTQ
jgi:hypothetical protein